MQVCVCGVSVAHCCCARGKNGNSRLSTKVKQNACCSKHKRQATHLTGHNSILFGTNGKIEHVRLRTQTTGATKGCLLLSHTRNVTSCRWQGWVVDPSSWHTDSSRTSRMLPGKRQGQRPKIYILPPRCGDQRHHGNLSTKLSSSQAAKSCRLCVRCNKVVEAATASRYVLRVCAEAQRPLS